MSRIQRIFAELGSKGQTALMPFITGGYPSLEMTARVLPTLETAGASVVEIGIPFSDPIADGPVIAASMFQALEAGVTPAGVFDAVSSARSGTELGIVGMVSHSIVMRMGPQRFIADAADAGFDGLIIPDIDTASAGPIADLLGERDMTLSLLVAPTTTPKRAEQIVKLCSGFVYLLGRTGLTGERDAAPQVQQHVQMVRQLTDLPIAVGFGVSTSEHVAAVTRIADAAIVGSALVRRMGDADDPVAAAGTFTAELAQGLHVKA